MEYLQLLVPLASTIITIIGGIIASRISYRRGRARSEAEVENLKMQKQSIQAAAGMDTAEASRVIAETSAAMLSPLKNLINDLQEQVTRLSTENIYLKEKNASLEARIALLERQVESI